MRPHRGARDTAGHFARDACAPALLRLAALCALAGCAQGVPDTDAGALPDAAAKLDADTLDLPDLDAPEAPRPPADAPALDAPSPDLPARDAPAPDLVDAPLPPDVPPDVGPVGPVVCTPTTASAVCGGRPCVDGYCCESACEGACRGCALPGAEGRCTIYRSATDPDAECAEQAPATCGTTGLCDGAGACARHPASTPCDDGMACTRGDVCDGAGACRGAAPTSCAPGAGNECCVGSCDAMSGCRTAAGLCADQCGANLLRTARVCQGCGAAGAAGACGGGGEFACDAMTHSLCRAIPCGGQTFTCTQQGGVWQWRAQASCDDGDPCTHGDACAAGVCVGTRITCASDMCTTRSCTGGASCMVTTRAGATCDDGNAMTANDVCSSTGVCAGTVVCAVPTDACANGTQSRDRCAGARIIGRRVAATSTGFTVTDTTCRASNRFDDCSWDAGADHAYRIWARAGETITANLSRGAACVGGSWRATLKLYQGGDCGTVTCSGDRWCRNFVNTSDQTYAAPRDGWIVVVVDGSTAFDDDGAYTLRVRLSGCRAGNCECP